jgi:hypothetical protein
MNYPKIYDDLISSRRILKRKKGDGVYYERHHIIPKACGGMDEDDNLILLTPKEHFIAHMLLIHCYSGSFRSKMVYALWRLINGRTPVISSFAYATAREMFIEEKAQRVVSQETRQKMSKARKGMPQHPDKGQKISEAKKGNSGQKLKGRTYEEIYGPEKAAEMRARRKNEMKGKTYDEIFGDKAEEQRKKLSRAQIEWNKKNKSVESS